MLHKLIFKIKYFRILNIINTFVLKICGLLTNSVVPISTKFTWPHKVKIGAKCILEHSIFFKHDGPYSKDKSILIGSNVFIGNLCEFNVRKKITVKDNVLIASGCKLIDHDHSVNKHELIRTQHGPEAEIILEEDVWLGANVIILKGVVVGQGAVVASGAVVNKSIPAYEIWGGVPARKIGERR